MRMLLDTHIVLWWMTDDKKLPRKAEEIIGDVDNEVYVSAASIWEVVIKKSLGRMQGDPWDIERRLHPTGFTELPITAKHAAKVAELPFHHKDPFDRMLVAQSLVEPMRLMTSDRQLGPYGEMVLLV